MTQHVSSFQSGIQCLAVIARVYQIPASPSQLLREFASTDSALWETNIIRAAKHIGLKCAASDTEFNKLETLSLPAIGLDHTGHYFIIAKFDSEGSNIVIQSMTSGQPVSLSKDEFNTLWTGRILLFTKRNAQKNTDSIKFGFKWFIPAFKKYKHYFRDVILASFFIQLLGLGSPIFFQVVIDKVLVHKGLTTLDVLAIGFFIVITFEVLLTGFRTWLFAHTTNRIDVELSSKLYRHLLSLPIRFFTQSKVGQTVARVKELENIRDFITGSSLTLILDVFFSFMFLGLMFYYAPLLTWIVVATIPCYVALSVIVTPTLRKRLEEMFQRNADNHAFLVESVTGVETIKATAIEPRLRNQWDERVADYVVSAFKTNNLNNIYSQTAAYINKVSSLLTLYFGALMVVAGTLTVGQFIAFNMLAQRVSGPIMRLVNLWQEFQQARVSLARLGDILNVAPEPGFNPNKASLPAIQGKVCFEHVTFRYNKQLPAVLTEVSFDVAPGKVIGIVGRSGSGKSTLTKLIQRIYVPESGRVLIDGVDLALVDPAWLRQQVGVVLQENFLFNDSVRNNICISDPGVSMEKVIMAARLAGAHEFILELPEGYDTQVGEHGASLSGGQRQRIAIARALITNPKILIFDEATSALDYESEAVIRKNMQQICQGRTVFIIAHRLTAIREANEILVIDKGRVVEQGSHDALLTENGIYRHLFSLQNGQPDDAQRLQSQSNQPQSNQTQRAQAQQLTSITSRKRHSVNGSAIKNSAKE